MREVDPKIKCWYTCNTDPNYDCRKICPRYKLMNFFIVNCGKPNADRYLKLLSPSKVDVKAFLLLDKVKTNISEYVNNGLNLFIASDKLQNGKTSWSLKIMYKYFDDVWCGSDFVPRGYFIYVPDFLSKMKNYDYKNTAEFKEIDKILKTVDLVIWDDITADKLNPQDQTVLNNYISQRLQNGKANIYNGLDNDLNEYLGKTLATRFESFEKILLRGEAGKVSNISLKDTSTKK